MSGPKRVSTAELVKRLQHHTGGEKWDCYACYWKSASCPDALILQELIDRRAADAALAGESAP